ncbi:MAG: leucyl/phenylalanyl-tRNA--protein transferase [Treponema sp.]|nr:leucyl/phenylalanyl-tRNA--protein transferase [Treponema sp.]
MKTQPGPDKDFPYLDTYVNFKFPDPCKWVDDIVSIGGNLSPGILLSAYEQGIFPWYGPDDPIIWQSPNPRCVIFPDKLHVSSSMKKIFNNNIYEITYDKDFYGVIKGCADKIRPGQNGTWITTDIIDAYTELHRLGWAHSAEAWKDGELAGGCYGVLLGRVFCGESMFAKKPNASKAAFLSLAKTMFDRGVAFIDCQVPNSHLMSLGGEEMARNVFLDLLKECRVSRY